MTETTETGFELNPGQLKLQKAIASPARYILARSGSGSGKTFAIVRALVVRGLIAPGSHQAIFRETATSARATIWKQVIPDVLRRCWPGLIEECKLDNTTMTLTLPNGSSILVLGLADDDKSQKLLGLNLAGLFVDECTEIADYGVITNLLTRLRQRVNTKAGNPLRAKAIFACNPDGDRHWTASLFKYGVLPNMGTPLERPENYCDVHISPYDNIANLGEDYIRELEGYPPKKRRRYLEGEWTAEVDGALFTLEGLDRHRVAQAPELKRVVVAVDPPVTSGDKADACGIVVAGQGIDDRYYVLADRTVQGLSPEGWAKAAVAAYREFEADRLVAEVNNGGDLVESVLRQIAPNVSYRAVRASRGKVARAEPVSALYDDGKVSHVGEMRELEDELCSLKPGFDPRSAGHSPDRADALVWAMTELMARSGRAWTGKVVGL